MPNTGLSGLLYRRTVSAAINSFRGLRYAALHEEAFRMQLFLSLFLVPTAIFIAVDYLQLILLILSLLLVLVVELLNTGIEVVIDRIGLEFHELSGRAKDIGSAAVALSMVAFAFVWGSILTVNYGSL
ncbi:MAG: diacylglycerol kinase [Porticoccaceae bacterium]|nr:diacylglycerol kinase [Porticoccaceae bacterium]